MTFAVMYSHLGSRIVRVKFIPHRFIVMIKPLGYTYLSRSHRVIHIQNLVALLQWRHARTGSLQLFVLFSCLFRVIVNSYISMKTTVWIVILLVILGAISLCFGDMSDFLLFINIRSKLTNQKAQLQETPTPGEARRESKKYETNL